MAEQRDHPQTYEYTYKDFVQGHHAQLVAADIPEELWPTLFTKLTNKTFDAGDYMSLIYEEDFDGAHPYKVITTQDLDHTTSVFLIDHAWTFNMREQKRILKAEESLLRRMADMVAVQWENGEEEGGTDDEIELEVREDGGEEDNQEEKRKKRMEYRHEEKKDLIVDEVIKKLWRYIGTYSIRFNQEGKDHSSTVWFVMDELGSRIAHSRTPNARLVPLFFIPHGMAYSILFFNKPLLELGEIDRDWTESLVSLQHPEWVDMLELAWIPRDFSFQPVDRCFPDEAFFTGGRSQDQLASESEQSACVFKPHSPVRIFTDDDQPVTIFLYSIAFRRALPLESEQFQLVEHLSVPYEMVSDWKEADIIWLHQHFYQYKDLAMKNPTALINQFPCECCITTKDLLAAILCKGKSTPPFYQMTFNLNTELPQFVSHFQRCEKSGEENTWIVKPWNLARGMDITVTNSIEQIIRLIETGPKIACKYIERPVLFTREDTGKRVKFDLRFIVFVNGVRPLNAYVYNDFWIRFAINEFSLDNLDDDETHFTVFNYADPTKILQMKCEEFVVGIEKSNPTINWDEMRKNINNSLRALLDEAAKEDAPRGISSNVQSRAMYGVDVMLQWNDSNDSTCSPSILEVNFMPDCSRACNYYPDFADTVFNTMFIGEVDPNKVTKL